MNFHENTIIKGCFHSWPDGEHSELYREVNVRVGSMGGRAVQDYFI